MRKLKLTIDDLAVKSFEVEQSPESRGTVVGNAVYCDGETDPKMEGPGTWATRCETWYYCTRDSCNGCVDVTGTCTTYDHQGC